MQSPVPESGHLIAAAASSLSKFESCVLEHLDAGHNLARWLMRNQQDAEDVVQESCMKALRAWPDFRGGDFRPWFLTIIRNTSFTRLKRPMDASGNPIERPMETGAEVAADSAAFDPQAIAIRAADAAAVRAAIAALPDVLREAIVLREMQGMSYKEIGKVAGVPIGTVMSRLSRGRAQLQALLMSTNTGETP